MIDTASAGIDTTPVTTDSGVDTSSVNTTTTDNADVPVEGATDEPTETETHNSDGSEKSEEERETFKTEAAAKAAGKEPLPQEIRKHLKAFRDADPANAAATKVLHSSYERWAATAPLLGREGITGLKSTLQEAGVKTVAELRQAFAQQSQSAEAVKSTDQLLYSGDKQLWANVADDLRATSHEDAFGKLAPSFLDTLRELDSESYHSLVTERSIEHMRASGLPEALNRLNTAVQGNAAAQGILKSIADWFNQNEESTSARAKEAQGLDRLAQEKTKWETEKSTAAMEAHQSSTAELCDKDNNLALGKALAPFLKLPFCSQWSRETKIDLGNALKSSTYEAMKADPVYQKQLAALWTLPAGENSKSKIQKFHQGWINDHADELVRKVVALRYPGAYRGGSASGRVAAAANKKAADTAAGRQSITNNKAIFMTKPKNLIREDTVINGRQFTTSDLTTLEIAGRGYVRGMNGTIRLITWRKPS